MNDPEAELGDREAKKRTGRRLMGRTARERWDIPEALRAPLIQRLGDIIRDHEAGNREVLAAAGALLAASKINLANIATTMKVREHEELEERIAEVERVIEEIDPEKSR